MRPHPSCQRRARLKRRMRCRSEVLRNVAWPTFQKQGRGDNPRPRSNMVFRLCRCRLVWRSFARPVSYDHSRAAKVENHPRLCAASRWFRLQESMFGSALCHESLRCCESRHGRKTEGSDSAMRSARGPLYRRWFHRAHKFAKK